MTCYEHLRQGLEKKKRDNSKHIEIGSFLPKRIHIFVLSTRHKWIDRKCCVCEHQNKPSGFKVGDIVISIRRARSGSRYYHFKCAKRKSVI